MAKWPEHYAQTHLCEVMEQARSDGPQTITHHGVERAIILSIEDYRALVAHKPDFKTYLLGGPKFDDLDVTRDQDTGRDFRF